MRCVVVPVIMFFQIVNLCVAVVAWCKTVIGPGFHDLFKLTFAVISPGLGKSGLKESAAAAAAIIVRSVGVHFHKVLLTHNRFYNIPHIFRHRITEALAYQLAWILYRKLYLQVLVPVGIHFQLSFTNPLSIVLNDAFALKVMLNVESLQSDPDSKKFVPSFRIEPDLAFEVINRFGLDPNNFFPVLQIRTEETVVFRCPAF